MADNVIKLKTPVYNNIMFDLKGHTMSNKALYIYLFRSNNLA